MTNPKTASTKKRIPIIIGESMKPNSTNSKVAKKQFHLFKYSFIPKTADTTQVATLQTSAHTSRDWIMKMPPHVNSTDAPVSFNTSIIPAKETECVLIFDAVRECYVLEKVESTMAFHPIRGGPGTGTGSGIKAGGRSNGNGLESPSPDKEVILDTSPAAVAPDDDPDEFGIDGIIEDLVEEDSKSTVNTPLPLFQEKEEDEDDYKSD